MLQDVVVKVVLLKSTDRAEHTLLEFEETNLVRRLDLGEHLFPEELKLLQEGWITTSHHTIDVGVICASSLNAHSKDLAEHVPVQSEHI